MYRPFQDRLERSLQERFALTARPIPAGLAYCQSDRGRHPALARSWCYTCPELRKIRYTYIDAGESAQIFNSVIYPDHRYDLPLLGMDFLSFGSGKNLIVMDFQPLFRDEAYMARYVAPLQRLHDRFPDLVQNLEMKFYDANQYFSPYLLFAKTDGATVSTRGFAAFCEYLDLYWQIFDQVLPNDDPAAIARVAQAQRDYDRYSAERDPASGLFSSYFGKEWAERFLHEFLFEEAGGLVPA